jgi:hypothetical protein
MFEPLNSSHSPSIGKIHYVYFFAARSKRIPGIPSSIHNFQEFIDRLFRFAGLCNGLSPLFPATSRTTIAGPAE